MVVSLVLQSPDYLGRFHVQVPGSLPACTSCLTLLIPIMRHMRLSIETHGYAEAARWVWHWPSARQWLGLVRGMNLSA
jgi:hypothetical protein